MIIFLCLGLIRSGIEGMEEQEQKYNTDNHIQVKQYQPFIGIYSRLTGNINNYNHPTWSAWNLNVFIWYSPPHAK